MTDANGITISNITANAALYAPGEPVTISFKFKNGSGSKIKKLTLDIVIRESDSAAIILHRFLGTLYNPGETVNLANGKSKTFSAAFNVSTDVARFFTANPDVRSAPIIISYTAELSSGNMIGTRFEISDLKILNCRFNPRVDNFILTRAAYGIPNDEGENALTTLQLAVDGTGYDYTRFFTAKVYQNEGGEASESDDSTDLTGKMADLITGVTDDPNILTGTYSKAYDWDFLLVFGDEYETFYGRYNLGRAFANMHLSGQPTGGVCFGGFCTSTYGSPKTESYYPIHAYAGIEGVTNYPESGEEVKTGGTWVDRKPIYRKVIPFGAVAAGNTLDTLLNIDIPETVIELSVMGKNTSGTDWYPIPYAASGANYQVIARLLNMTAAPALRIRVQSDAAALGGGYAIISYTKQADEPLTPNDYAAAFMDADGAAVADVSGNEVFVRAASGDVYQSRYTGAQIDAGIATANNALPKSGGTMTGLLALSADPTEASHAATKRYVDDAIGNIQLTPGKNGASAYEIAQAEGFEGTQAEWLESLHGADGKSAFETAQDGGYTGTEDEFAEALGSIGKITEADSVKWNNIPDKPFGLLITGTAKPNGNTLTWDGNGDQTPINSGLRYFVSENVPSMADINAGYSYAVKVTGSDAELDRGYITPIEYENYIFFGNDDGAYIYIVKTPGAKGTTSFSRAGIYFVNTYGVYTARLTIDSYTFTASTEIAPIPEKYIPGSIARQSAIDALLTVTSGKIQWDGTIGDREVATNLDGALDGDTYVRVSETFIYPDELYKGGCKVYLNGSLSGTAYTEAEAQQMITDFTETVNSRVFWFQPGVYSVMYTEGGAIIPNLRSFPKPGVYFRKGADGSYVSGLESAGITALMAETHLNLDLLPTLSSFTMKTSGGKKFRITINADGEFEKTAL